MIDFFKNKYVIGVDEAGRGPLAGPVVAAAIIVDSSIIDLDVKDSKLLTNKRREELFNYLIQKYKYAISIVEPSVIDNINILNATKKSMNLAICHLKQDNDYPIYVDGNFKPYDEDDVHAIIKGDLLLKPISAASVLAKVTRDNLMREISKQYPQYNWHKNFGYGTEEHIKAIKEFGPTKYHRQSFIKNFI